MSTFFPPRIAVRTAGQGSRLALSLFASAIFLGTDGAGFARAAADPPCRIVGEVLNSLTGCPRPSHGHLPLQALTVAPDPPLNPNPIPNPNPAPIPLSSSTELDQTISITFNTFVSFPNVAQPIRRAKGTVPSAMVQSLAANSSYGIGVGVATNGMQTAIAIGGAITGAGLVSGNSGTSAVGVGQGIGIAIALDTPTSVTNAFGSTVITQVIAILVNTRLAIFGAGAPSGTGVVGALPTTGMRTTSHNFVASNADVSLSGSGILATSATLTGSTSVASVTQTAGMASAAARSANAGSASALLVAATDPAGATQTPMTVNQTLMLTANTIMGPSAPAPGGFSLPQSTATTGLHTSIAGAGLAAGSGSGPGNGLAIANGSGSGMAAASGLNASSANGGGQSLALAATGAPTLAGTNGPSITVTMNADLSAGVMSPGTAQGTNPASRPSLPSGSAGTASAAATGNGSITLSSLSSTGSGAAVSEATAAASQTVAASGGSLAVGSASRSVGSSMAPMASQSTGSERTKTATEVGTAGGMQATGNAIAGGQSTAVTKSSPLHSGHQASVGTAGRSATGAIAAAK